MIDVVLSRMIQGILSGIGIGTIFYFYPIIRDMISQKYRYQFRFNKGGMEAFKKETRKYFKIGLSYGFIYGFVIGTIVGPFGSLNGI